MNAKDLSPEVRATLAAELAQLGRICGMLPTNSNPVSHIEHAVRHGYGWPIDIDEVAMWDVIAAVYQGVLSSGDVARAHKDRMYGAIRLRMDYETMQARTWARWFRACNAYAFRLPDLRTESIAEPAVLIAAAKAKYAALVSPHPAPDATDATAAT